MEIEQKLLDGWAMEALHVNGCLLGALDAISKGDLAKAERCVQEARGINWETEKALVAAGAADPIQVRQMMLGDDLPEEDRPLRKPETYDLAKLTLEGGPRGTGE